ncbi:Hypothetical predicted protein [Podarcis lilfordi]|uniref:Uncharacterized protein n=1 Tax=Podarcis lilfordi TaxID=74358 RepID=A0AA35PPR5_9SAUR|nr:Hypothetical predicted protein [Podarcis lilfordi]
MDLSSNFHILCDFGHWQKHKIQVAFQQAPQQAAVGGGSLSSSHSGCRCQCRHRRCSLRCAADRWSRAGRPLCSSGSAWLDSLGIECPLYPGGGPPWEQVASADSLLHLSSQRQDFQVVIRQSL